MSVDLRALLRAQARAAIEAARPGALALFDAYDALASAPSPEAQTPEPVRLVTKQQLRELLAIKSDRTIEAMMTDDRIPVDAIIRIGRKVRFDLARVIEALRGRRSNAQAWGARVGGLRAIDGGRP